MILLDETYFDGELSLPNIPVHSCGDAGDGVAYAIQTVAENRLSVFSDKYVIDYLTRLLGKRMTDTFLEEIEKQTPGQIWLDLKDQLLFTAGSLKLSPMANYVYFMIMRNSVTKTTTAGEADPLFDYATNASNRYKLVSAWNDMARMTEGIVKWLCEHRDDYKEYADCEGVNISSITYTLNKFGL
jgi:hypothetical protein